MKAIHFGAGNIGRGFIGMLLNRSNYHTTFVDVNAQIITAINEKKQYTVILADENKQEETVTNISGINSMENPSDVVDAIVEADIITTAVGPTILPIIAKLMAEGLSKRLEHNQTPLNIIACENMIGGSALLKEELLTHVLPEMKVSFEATFAFPNAAVDRIVPNQTNEEILTVAVEPYYEWVVDSSAIKGQKPAIEGITYVKDLTPFIERKLFTVNTGHAVAAYLGYNLGYETIKQAMDSQTVLSLVRETLKESGNILIEKYGFQEETHQQYIDKIIGRFLNPHISDEVTRVARGPLRKLGHKDRLVRPALLHIELLNQNPVYLAKAIAAALQYDFKQDDEAVSLQQIVKEKGYAGALEEVAGLPKDSPLVPVVLKQIEQLKDLK